MSQSLEINWQLNGMMQAGRQIRVHQLKNNVVLIDMIHILHRSHSSAKSVNPHGYVYCFQSAKNSSNLLQYITSMRIFKFESAQLQNTLIYRISLVIIFSA